MREPVKKILLVVLAIALVIAVLVAARTQVPDGDSEGALPPIVETDSYRLINDSANGVRIVVFPAQSLKYILDSTADLTFADWMTTQGLNVAVNGGYFLGENTDAQHAGLLIIDGQVLADIAYGDKQVTHVAIVDNDTVHFVANAEYVYGDYELAFQAGPLVLDYGGVQSIFITEAPNGEGTYRRTLFGTWDSDHFFFLVTTRSYTLEDLANYLLAREDTNAANLSAINLDGGLSTALYVKDYPKFNFNTSWYLPIAIGF